MKLQTLKGLAITVILAVCIITGFSRSSITPGRENSGNAGVIPQPRPETITGTTEFYFRPVDDSRIWHVVNRYISPDSEDQPEFNTSEYNFSSDSVTVLNEFIGVPETTQWDLGLS